MQSGRKLRQRRGISCTHRQRGASCNKHKKAAGVLNSGCFFSAPSGRTEGNRTHRATAPTKTGTKGGGKRPGTTRCASLQTGHGRMHEARKCTEPGTIYPPESSAHRRTQKKRQTAPLRSAASRGFLLKVGVVVNQKFWDCQPLLWGFVARVPGTAPKDGAGFRGKGSSVIFSG